MRPIAFPPQIAAVTLLAASAAFALQYVTTAPAHACGGFFCNGANPTPIFQSGERVLFVKHDDQVTMHIEVTYEGEPTEFGWIIPVVNLPTNAMGQPLPLEESLGVSSQALFPMLQNMTDPVWTTQVGPSEGELCEDTGSGFGCAEITIGPSDAMSVAGSTNERVGPGGDIPVTVVDDAKVGPYDAQLIQATSSDALYTWLNDNGYYQDPVAKPLLAHYVSQGFSFIGIRLANGKATGDIKPIALTLGENAPCVPLRLTAIAATEGMPIRVWVVGDSRAIPKNFLHATVNEQAVTYPFGTNYDTVVDEAIQQAGGRAFVTEYAGPVDDMRNRLLAGWEAADDGIAGIESADNLGAVIAAYEAAGFPTDNLDYVQLVEEETSDAETLKSRLVDEVIRPLQELEMLLDGGAVLTRLYTRMDPAHMTRDPIFSFNPDLPDVSLNRTMTVSSFTDSECNVHQIATWDDGRRYTEENFISTFSGYSVAGATALAHLEVLEETGEGIRVDPAQAEEIDSMLDQAELGTPVLSDEERAALNPVASIAMFPNPPPDFNGEGGCDVSGKNATAAVLLMCVALLFWRRRTVA